ncbi:hypothetical protein Pcinc_029977 [Petrolisthes cinctipes]|uniref:Uncharacterized protein n=1 Tax=Petrolisthes cinctipes TaxID=88211 RepID=A0AAE1EZR7_PETCI|nr:hypothetical protein Pcinc_029977 [Petrolisthes cinctipes]
MVWRDPDVFEALRGYIRKYMKATTTTTTTTGTNTQEDQLQDRQDQLEVLATTLETLAVCLRGTQRCQYKMKVLSHNKYEGLCQLLSEVLRTPEVPPSYKLTCERWLTDFRELSSLVWENLPECELLKLVQEVIHATTSALYELIACVNEMTWTTTESQQHQQHQQQQHRQRQHYYLHTQESSPPNLTVFLQHVSVEGWLTYSVPQLLTLLQPERTNNSGGSSSGSGGSEIQGGQRASLLHQYLSVLSALLQHSPRALQYCATVYAEELRYYVQETVVGSVVGNCPLRPHTLAVVRHVAQLVRSNNDLRTR